MALSVLQNDLHVFMEEPVANSNEDAETLTELSKNYPKLVLISQNYRYCPEILASAPA
ncbi:hypothetical protein F9U64_21310 [Gracilibacillus oryzae]|uniref:Uncharacterized protein n=1 Tax=Gracilibacillus oryzae TaxID=1672701 RepID=A0A7C8L0T1_9BACI|nr:hypothetical protein F9U64_21310 [Gracilibacillus oryzae]